MIRSGRIRQRSFMGPIRRLFTHGSHSLSGLVAGILVGFLLRVAASGAEANHPYPGNHYHIYSMNSAGEDEDWCVSNNTSQLTHEQSVTKIDEALRGFPPISPDIPWNSVRNIDFVASNAAGCDRLSLVLSIEPLHEIYFYIYDDIEPYDTCTGAAGCVDLIRPRHDPYAAHPEDEYTVGKVWIRTDALILGQLTVVNHEMGHILGLSDGGPLENCVPVVTIMHCVDQQWPSNGDRFTVDSLIPAGSGDWNNFSYQKAWF